MLISQIFLGLPGIVGLVVAAPHKGMIDLPGYRDIGVFFEQEDYKGESKFLLEAKYDNECISLGRSTSGDANGDTTGVQISSIQVCFQTACSIFSSNNCTKTKNDYAIMIKGPIDIPKTADLDITKNNVFKSYVCGEAATKATVDRIIEAQQGHEGRFAVRHIEIDTGTQV